MNESFENMGYVIAPQVVDADRLSAIAALMTSAGSTQTEHRRSGSVFAMRDVFAAHAELFALAASDPLLSLARALGGPGARPTKATFFDKSPEANWTLPLHQDLTITVANHAKIPGYTHWSTKAGVPHVQPPVAVLERIVALRVHLDNCPAENGALEVVPGSHRRGRLSAREIREMHERDLTVVCPAAAGDVLAMRPLLVHGSRKATVPGRRRVLHVEYSAGELDPPLRWPVWTA